MVRIRSALVFTLLLAAPPSAAQSLPALRLSWGDCASTESNRQWSGASLYRQVVSVTGYAGGAQGFEIYIAVGRDFSSPAWRCAFYESPAGSTVVHAASTSACADALPVANLEARLQVGTLTPEGPLYVVVRGELDAPLADPLRRCSRLAQCVRNPTLAKQQGGNAAIYIG